MADISQLLEAINLPQGQEVVGKSDFDLFPKIIAFIERHQGEVIEKIL